MAEFKKAASKSEIPEGSGKTVQIEGKAIALFNVAGQFYAISNTCAHRGGPLGEGDLAESTVTCPWHGWAFDVKTGSATHTPASVQTYPIKIEGDTILVEI